MTRLEHLLQRELEVSGGPARVASAGLSTHVCSIWSTKTFARGGERRRAASRRRGPARRSRVSGFFASPTHSAYSRRCVNASASNAARASPVSAASSSAGTSTSRGSSSSSSTTSTTSPSSMPAASRISRRSPRTVSPPYTAKRPRIGVPLTVPRTGARAEPNASRPSNGTRSQRPPPRPESLSGALNDRDADTQAMLTRRGRPGPARAIRRGCGVARTRRTRRARAPSRSRSAPTSRPAG